MVLPLFGGKSLSPQCKVDCKGEKQQSSKEDDADHGCRSYQLTSRPPETMTLASDLMGRMVLDTESPSRLRTARNCFAKWASESPENAALEIMVAPLDARLKFLGKRSLLR
jgi:hypothetical protein